jgi:hypothetical protein
MNEFFITVQQISKRVTNNTANKLSSVVYEDGVLLIITEVKNFVVLPCTIFFLVGGRGIPALCF